MESSPKRKMKTVERAVEILSCFETKQPLGITEIGEMLGLSKSTVFGFVDTLVSCGMLAKDSATGKYQLGLKIYQLSLHTNLDLRSVVKPYLTMLVEEFGETANLVQHDDTHIIYIEKMEGTHAMRICTTVGLRLPFYCSGVGQSMLAYMSEESIARAAASYDYRPYAPNTVKNAGELIAKLASIRQQGYSIDDEEFESGVFCIGVPVFSGQGLPIAGISVSGPKSRMDENTVAGIADRLLDYSRSITKTLFG